MYDKLLVIETVEQVINAVEIVVERCQFAKSYNDFIDTKVGQEKLDGICMKLIAIGEGLKNIDKITDKKLLEAYPQIEWSKIKGIRDFISHHYFDLDAEVVYNICEDNIGDLLATLNRIRSDLIQTYRES